MTRHADLKAHPLTEAHDACGGGGGGGGRGGGGGGGGGTLTPAGLLALFLRDRLERPEGEP